MTLGRKIAEGRRAKGLSQEDLAGRLGVSPQAVSKWENDISCPDIQLLPRLAKLLDTSVDAMLSQQDAPAAPPVRLLPTEKRRPLEELTLRIHISSAGGDKVRLNLPMAIVKLGLEIGMTMPQFQLGGNDVLKNVDLAQVLGLVEQGMVGHLLEVESADGDKIDIAVD